MNQMKLHLHLAGAAALAIVTVHTAQADLFGTGPNTFTIDFVTIGNAGNTDDLGAGGGLYSTPYGGVSYEYRMGTYEISTDQIVKANASGLANVSDGVLSGNLPAAGLRWEQAALFVNWLNTSTGHQAAYNVIYQVIDPPGPTPPSATYTTNLWASGDAWQLGGENRYRHKDAYYFLPSEDEWYKAAYHQNDGVTANYWDYATGGNSAPIQELVGGTIPGSAVYESPEPGTPLYTNVTFAGGFSPYGTMGQNGNIKEWTESHPSGTNNIWNNTVVVRGGGRADTENELRSSTRTSLGTFAPGGFAWSDVGFRVASIPEPSSALLLAGTGLGLLLRRRR